MPANMPGTKWKERFAFRAEKTLLIDLNQPVADASDMAAMPAPCSPARPGGAERWQAPWSAQAQRVWVVDVVQHQAVQV